MARLAIQTEARAGTITLVRGYATAASLSLGQLYRARPRQIAAPSAYIDRITEDADSFTREESQRVVRVGLRVLWGLSVDAGEAVDQRDRFVDGFYAYVMDHRDAFGANAMVTWVSVSDDPDFTPEWVTGSESYFMTEIVLEGFAAT